MCKLPKNNQCWTLTIDAVRHNVSYGPQFQFWHQRLFLGTNDSKRQVLQGLMVVVPIIHGAKLNITKSAFLLWDPGLFWAKVGSLLPPTWTWSSLLGVSSQENAALDYLSERISRYSCSFACPWACSRALWLHSWAFMSWESAFHTVNDAFTPSEKPHRKLWWYDVNVRGLYH